MDESIAVCKFQFVLRHESGTSIQPRGLSIAMTERSSKMMGIASQPGSSMKFGLAITHRLAKLAAARKPLVGRAPAAFTDGG